ncbi:MAG: GNAT family N-acetyltransferase [Panacagrimonas sp.]
MRWLKRRDADPVAPQANAAARPVELATARLHLRPLGSADVGVLHALWTAPEVRLHLWNDHTLREEQTRDLLMQSEYLFGERGYGLWGGFDADNQMIGFAGYWFFRNEHELELLYGVAEPHWYRGYAREMAQALIGYGFEHLQLDEIRASAEAANAGSVRLLKRLGFLGDFQRGAGSQTLFFRLPHGVYGAGGGSNEAI